MKLSPRRVALAAASLALVGGTATLASPATALNPVDDGGTSSSALSPARQLIVDRANAALSHHKKFRTSADGTTYDSTILADQGRNVLEKSGFTPRNFVQYNDFNGLEWCGYFAAAMWGGENTPSAGSDGYGVPDGYAASQNWRNDRRFEEFSSSSTARPEPGDVLVWQNVDTSTGGHVGVVTAYNASTGRVTTVEGNVGGDEIARKTYTWGSRGPVQSDKNFRGFLSRTL